jgi:hypothetical protein
LFEIEDIILNAEMVQGNFYMFDTQNDLSKQMNSSMCQSSFFINDYEQMTMNNNNNAVVDDNESNQDDNQSQQILKEHTLEEDNSLKIE